MKVLVSRFSWQPKTPGGAEKSAFAHYKFFLKNDVVDPTFITNIRSFKGSSYVPLPGERHLQQIIGFLLLPLQCFKKYELYNAHSRTDQIVYTYLKIFHKRPVIWKDAGDLMHQIKLYRSNLYQRLNQSLLLGAVRRADAIYTLNGDELSSMLDLFDSLNVDIDKEKFFVVPSDISFKDYNRDIQPVLATDKIVIGVMGRIEFSSKGFDVFGRSLEGLDKNTYEVWVVGDGPDLIGFKKIMHTYPTKYFGYQENISPYLQGMDIFVQPSNFEGFGRTVKEAMYFGKAVIGSNVGGIKDQIENNKTGLLFSHKNEEELRSKINLLMKNSQLRKKLGLAAKRKVEKEGDIDTLLEKKVMPIFKKIGAL